MDHAISVNLVANIDRYKQGMQQAKQVGTESLGFIASIFEKIKSMFAGLWDSIKSIFSGVWDKIKSGFNSMADGVAGAFQKLTGHTSGLNSSLDGTKSKMAETEGQSMSLAGKIGITLVAAVVAVTGVVGTLTRAGLNVASTFAGLATSSDIAVSQLSRFDNVAARNGMSIKEMGDSMAKFRDAMSKAAAGDGGDVFDKLGVKVTDSKNALLQTDDVLIATAKKISGMSSEAEKYDAAAKAGFGGKVQLLEDIAHASDLTASQTDEQAAAVVRLGKIWHEILPGGKSMWAGIRDSITTSLTPAMAEASTSILEAKNRITDAFQQIFGGGSWLTKLGNLIKDWSQQASKWFDGVAKSATDSTIQMMKWIAAKTGLGNPDAFKPGGAGYIPGAVPLVSGKSTPIVTDAEKEAAKQYDATTKAITEKIAAQKLEAQTGQVLTEGQRMALQMMVGLRDGTLQLTDAQKIERTAQYSALIAQEAANKQMLDSRAAAEAAAQKEVQSYATLSSQIQGKIDEDKLQLASNLDLSDSQKMLIKLDAELASGKLKLTAAHEAAARAKLAELGVTEQQLKADQAQQDVAKYINESVIARNKLTDALAVEYKMYGKTSDARAIAMVAVDAEIWRQQELARLIADKKPITDKVLADLEKEKALRIEVGQATLSQTQALQYANQLIDENKKFGLEYIADDKARAAAELAIDADMWQERIRLAGDGTEAQKLLQQQYDVWYKNQSMKPALEEQKQMWTSIEQTAHDTFVSIFDSGKSAFDRLRDALKNGLLDLLYQMTLKKWIISIGASVGMGGAGLAQAATGGTGDLFATAGSVSSSPLMSAVSAASGLYKSISGGLSGLGDSIASSMGSGIASLGQTFGNQALASFGKGMQGFGADGSLGTMAGYGQTAGFVAGKLANIGAGYMLGSGLNSAISGQYSTGSGLMTTEKIATAVASYFGPQFGALAGAVSGLVNRAFGMGPREVTSQGLSGTLTADSLTGQSYTNWHQNGGWFRSDKNGTDTAALTAATVAQFTQGLQAIEVASSGFAKSLGVSADWVSTFSKTFDLKLTGDATKDQQAVADFFTGIGNEIANKLVPNLVDFSKTGETASATLERLAGDFQATDQVAQLIGKTAAQAFGTAGIESAKAREQLVALAGSASTLTSQAQSYAQNYLTDAEKLAPVQNALDAAMASLGLSSVQTRDQFKAVVNSLDLTTEAGAKEFTSLMALADAFAQVHPAADDAATAAQKAADALNAIKDAGTALLGDVDSSFSALQKVVEREKSAVQTVIDAHTAAVSKLQSLSQSLHSTLNSMLSPDQQAMARTAAQAQIRSALAIAKAGGVLPDADSLKDALSAVSKTSTDQFGTYQDYLKDLYQTQNDIAALGNVTDDQLTVEQKALTAAQDQLKSLDAILTKYQDQIDVLKGQSTTLLSIDQATQGVLTAILAAKANPVVAATSSINDAYQSALGRAPDAAGQAYWQQQAASGVSASDIKSAIGNSEEAQIQKAYKDLLGRSADASGLSFWLQSGASVDAIKAAIMTSGEYKSLHPFAVGTNFIPEDMPAMVHKGERIIPAADNRALMARLTSPSSNNDALLAELKAVRQELAELRQKNSAENVAQVKQLQTTVDLLQRVIYGGDSIQTKAVS